MLQITETEYRKYIGSILLVGCAWMISCSPSLISRHPVGENISTEFKVRHETLTRKYWYGIIEPYMICVFSTCSEWRRSPWSSTPRPIPDLPELHCYTRFGCRDFLHVDGSHYSNDSWLVAVAGHDLRPVVGYASPFPFRDFRLPSTHTTHKAKTVLGQSQRLAN